MSKIICFGEVLWDMFSDYKAIGGAPLNVACRLASFNNDVSIISSIGNDNLGKNIITFLKQYKVNTNLITINQNYTTGEVSITLDTSGTATYDIVFPKAWDYIKLNTQLKEQVTDVDAFIFGSLAARHTVSKQTLNSLLTVAPYKVFDINLRAPHYTQELLIALIDKADFVKCNDEELFEIAKYLGSYKTTIKDIILFIANTTNTKHICVTKGAKGAILYYNTIFYEHDGYPVTVVDTVGAGDSFLATLIHHLLNHETPDKALDTACAVGALVANSKGANPIISQEKIEKLILD